MARKVAQALAWCRYCEKDVLTRADHGISWHYAGDRCPAIVRAMGAVTAAGKKLEKAERRGGDRTHANEAVRLANRAYTEWRSKAKHRYMMSRREHGLVK